MEPERDDTRRPSVQVYASLAGTVDARNAPFTAARDPNHFRWVGEKGLHLMTIPWVNPRFDMAPRPVAGYRESLRQAGHDPASREVLALFPVYVSDSDKQARREVEPYWSCMCEIVSHARGGTRREDPVDVLVADNRALFGGPDTCALDVLVSEQDWINCMYATRITDAPRCTPDRGGPAGINTQIFLAVTTKNLTPEQWQLYVHDEPYRKTCPALP